MQSLRHLYRIGFGPSSSHTMGPRRAAELFRKKHPEINRFKVTLFGSLAATGRGHLTDTAILDVFHPLSIELLWKPEESIPMHPNGMQFESLDENNKTVDTWQVYSIGGGELKDKNSIIPKSESIYQLTTMKEILSLCNNQGLSFWEYVKNTEAEKDWLYLEEVLDIMLDSIENGLEKEGVLPGKIGLQRKANIYYRKTTLGGVQFKRTGFLSAYALAVAEQNASGGKITTAPTCGSCGVLPAVLRFLKETIACSRSSLIKALATASLIGNLIKKNGSLSGAEVGCQGEIGSACSMASAAAAQLLGGTPPQIEYAAEMGMEHYLGLTCDPVDGLVQIPCIERNAFAAIKSLAVADYAMFSDGHHRISFDEVINVMLKTGHDIPPFYRETSTGGLAAAYKSRK